MKILFLGTSEFACPSLKRLSAIPDFHIVGVVTQPDRPRGRGRHSFSSPVHTLADELYLPVLQPEKVREKDFIRQVRALNPDVLALAAFGQIIPRSLLELAPLGPINLHGSLLPFYRGAAPIQYALLNGEKKTGVTTMWMAPELDAGDILLQSSLEIGSDEDAGELTMRLSHLGAELLVQTLYLLEKGGCPRIVQDHSRATFAPSITPADCIISWEESSERCSNRIRALSPRPGAVAALRQKKVKIWRAMWHEISAQGVPGEIVQIQSKDVLVNTGSGTLTLQEVQPENSRRMSAGDWARGARIAPGDRFDSADYGFGASQAK